MAPPEDDIHEKIDGEQEVSASSLRKIKELKSLRTSTKGNLTRMKALITKKGTSLATEELDCRLGMLEEDFKKVKSVQDDIDKLSQYADVVACEAIKAEIEDIYVATKIKIMSLLAKRRPPVADISMMNTTTSLVAAPRVRRDVKLPRFEGKYSEFPKFMALFNKLIHQDEMFDNCERFLILKEHLGSRPLSAIADFDVTDENYPKALGRLNECFDKKALMFEEHITALCYPKVYKIICHSSKTCC